MWWGRGLRLTIRDALHVHWLLARPAGGEPGDEAGHVPLRILFYGHEGTGRRRWLDLSQVRAPPSTSSSIPIQRLVAALGMCFSLRRSAASFQGLNACTVSAVKMGGSAVTG